MRSEKRGDERCSEGEGCGRRFICFLGQEFFAFTLDSPDDSRCEQRRGAILRLDPGAPGGKYILTVSHRLGKSTRVNYLTSVTRAMRIQELFKDVQFSFLHLHASFRWKVSAPRSSAISFVEKNKDPGYNDASSSRVYCW